MSARRRLTRDRLEAPDAGFTTVELVTALAVFSVLMVIVSAAMLSGLRSVREASTRSQVQVEQQTAIEWSSRLLRYTDNPYATVPLPAAITEATATSITFYTFSGTGPVDRVAYKARLSVQTDGLVSEVWTPTYVAGVPTYPSPAARRVLVRPSDSGLPALTLTYFERVGTGLVPMVPPAGGALTEAQRNAVAAIRVDIDGGVDAIAVTQTIELVNPRT